MKKRIQRIVELVFICCILACVLTYISRVVARKGYTQRMPFYDQKEDFDILFFGTSHVMDGIFPMELWKDYGLVSYNFGMAGQELASSYWDMRNALEYTTPKLVVIDCYYLRSKIKTSTNYANVQSLMDCIPTNRVKVQAINDLLQDSDMEKILEQAPDLPERNVLPFLWNYAAYHGRWDELLQEDFEVTASVEKGAVMLTDVAVPDEVEKIPAEQRLEGDTVGVEYVKKMIEECQKRDIEVLLVYLPFAASESYQEEANRVYEIASEYSVNYINFLDEDVVNYNTDFQENSNSNGHLNVSGARKVTNYLGQYIVDNYDIPDQRANALYSEWEHDYAEYAQFKANKLKTQKSLESYLVLSNDKRYDVLFVINNQEIFQNEFYAGLFENLGVSTEKITGQTELITVSGTEKTADYVENFRESGGETALGRITWVEEENEMISVLRNGESVYQLSKEQDEKTDVQIVVFENETMRVVDCAGFDMENQAMRQ